ncbi:helix-turn-helix domain-containing protein [Mycetohabitans sp. B46]|uniref:helix-turn-helix domain-containing protein n=1 Tax=Mycetohabitans sp. B46 TaxID=2772536 RepID=UPI00307DD9F0
MNTVGTRLREERLRLGLSQEEFAAVGGVLRGTQSKYESDERSPDAKYLSAVVDVGVDLLYVLRGVRLPSSALAGAGALTEADRNEQDLFDSYRQLNEAGKAALQVFLLTCLEFPMMSATSTPRRAKRLAKNRRAMFDQRTAENVDRAKLEIERLRRERAAKTKSK